MEKVIRVKSICTDVTVYKYIYYKSCNKWYLLYFFHLIISDCQIKKHFVPHNQKGLVTQESHKDNSVFQSYTNKFM